MLSRQREQRRVPESPLRNLRINDPGKRQVLSKIYKIFTKNNRKNM